MAFANSIPIRIDSSKIDATLTNFPLRLYLTGDSGPDGIDFSDVFTELGDSDRKKLSVMSGATECYVEIVYWDAASEKAILDVRVPSVSSSADTELDLYYDSTEPENTDYVGDTGSTPAQTVWDGNFTAVYHLGQDPTGGSGCIAESTTNGRDGTPAGSMTTGDLVTTGLAPGLSFDGTDDIVTAAAPTAYTNLTVEAFFSVDPLSNTRSMVTQGKSGEAYDIFNLYWTASTMRFGYRDSADGWTAVSTALTDTDDHYAAGTYTAADTKIRVALDGGSPAASAAFTRHTSLESTLRIGGQKNGVNDYGGMVYEVRLSNIVRSAAWIKATYNGLSDTLILSGGTETTDDVSTRTTLTDGTVLEDMAAPTRLAAWQIDDLAGATKLAGWDAVDLATRSNMARRATGDLATRGPLTDGAVLTDLATRCLLTDGAVLTSMATRCPMIKQAPVYQAVIAQRLRSVKNGV
jgi:hypothetical protein